MLSASADFDNKRPIDFVLSLFDGAKLGIQAGNPVDRSVANALSLSADDKDKNVDYAKIAAETTAKEIARLYGPTAAKLGVAEAPKPVAGAAA
jgi:hypothetical protein